MNVELAERIFRVIPDIVFCVKDEKRTYRSANLAFVHRLGLKSEDQVIGKRAEELFPADLAEVYQKQDEDVLLRGSEFSDRLDVIGLASISRDLDTPSAGDLKMAGLQRVVDWVYENLEKEMTVSDLAKIAKMKQAHLERRVKRVFKMSVGQFVRRARIDRAAQLLQNSDLGIAEIALECGYSEQSSLTRQFKSAVGCPPGEFRKKRDDSAVL